MHHDPTNPDPWHGHPVIDMVETELRHFGGQSLTRARAAALLEFWQHRPTLTDREIAAVLARFPS